MLQQRNTGYIMGLPVTSDQMYLQYVLGALGNINKLGQVEYFFPVKCAVISVIKNEL